MDYNNNIYNLRSDFLSSTKLINEFPWKYVTDTSFTSSWNPKSFISTIDIIILYKNKIHIKDVINIVEKYNFDYRITDNVHNPLTQIKDATSIIVYIDFFKENNDGKLSLIQNYKAIFTEKINNIIKALKSNFNKYIHIEKNITYDINQKEKKYYMKNGNIMGNLNIIFDNKLEELITSELLRTYKFNDINVDRVKTYTPSRRIGIVKVLNPKEAKDFMDILSIDKDSTFIDAKHKIILLDSDKRTNKATFLYEEELHNKFISFINNSDKYKIKTITNTKEGYKECSLIQKQVELFDNRYKRWIWNGYDPNRDDNDNIDYMKALNKINKITFNSLLTWVEFDNKYCWLINGNINQKSNYHNDYRKDLNRAFRSSWEANLARILTYEGKEYEYEPDYFRLNNHNGGYIPDFKVGSKWLEVKGWFSKDDLKKIYEFKNQYESEELIVIDPIYYSELYNGYNDKVKLEQENAIDSSIKTNVVGITFDNRIDKLNRLDSNSNITIEIEKNNRFDKNAITVKNDKEEILGYIPKELASILAPRIDNGETYCASIIENKKYKKSYSFKIKIMNEGKTKILTKLKGLENNLIKTKKTEIELDSWSAFDNLSTGTRYKIEHPKLYNNYIKYGFDLKRFYDTQYNLYKTFNDCNSILIINQSNEFNINIFPRFIIFEFKKDNNEIENKVNKIKTIISKQKNSTLLDFKKNCIDDIHEGYEIIIEFISNEKEYVEVMHITYNINRYILISFVDEKSDFEYTKSMGNKIINSFTFLPNRKT